MKKAENLLKYPKSFDIPVYHPLRRAELSIFISVPRFREINVWAARKSLSVNPLDDDILPSLFFFKIKDRDRTSEKYLLMRENTRRFNILNHIITWGSKEISININKSLKNLKHIIYESFLTYWRNDKLELQHEAAVQTFQNANKATIEWMALSGVDEAEDWQPNAVLKLERVLFWYLFCVR